MDGITLYALRYELGKYLPLKVQKIYQPAKDRLVIHVWNKEIRERLEMAFTGMRPYFGFSRVKDPNPKTPPSLTLALRKRLEGGSLVAIRQEGLDRVLYLDFEGHDDFGNSKRFVLVFDMAGKGSNLGLYQDAQLIISMLTPDDERFSVGDPYVPPSSEKCRPSPDMDVEAVARALTSRGADLSSAIMAVFDGLGKEISQTIAIRAGCCRQGPFSIEQARLAASLIVGVAADLAKGRFSPGVYRKGNGDLTFHAFRLEGLLPVETFSDSLSAAVFYREQSLELMRFRSEKASMLALAERALKKVEARLDAQRQDLAKAKDHEVYRLYAELIDATGLRTPAGSDEMTVLDYYSDPPAKRIVPLDPRYGSSENARRYYAKYKKGVRAQKVLTESVAHLESLAAEAKAMASFVKQASSLDDLLAIEPALLRLASTAGLRLPAGRNVERDKAVDKRGVSPGSAHTGPSLEVLMAPSGSTVFVGGNAQKNDYLITRLKRDGDLWFHVKGDKGAHVLLRSQNPGTLTEEDILFAAKIAAKRSRAGQSSKVEVDYVDAGKVKKPRGAAPGFVTYSGQKTILVSPDSESLPPSQPG